MRIDKNFVNNKFVSSNKGVMLSVYNPATEAVVGQVQAATTEEALEAVAVASNAQKGWRQLTSIERAGYMHKLADALLARKEAIGPGTC